MNRTALTAGVWLIGAASTAWGGPGVEGNWHQWRGPMASGVAPKADPPVEWSEQKNVRWKTELPGEGDGSPVIWGDVIYVQVAVKTDRQDENAASKQDEPGQEPGQERGPESRPSEGGDGRGPESRPADDDRREGRRGEGRRGEGRRGEGRPGGGRGGRRQEKPTNYYQWSVIALDRKTGQKVWERIVREEVPHEGSHPDGSMASTSAITDGEHVFAWFGSRGLYALDMQGKPVWDHDFGDMNTRNSFGEGGSPALHGDTLVVNWDHEGESFIVALDKRTGRERWRKTRDERTSWATPLMLEADGKTQVITSAANRVRSYDLENGELIWECGGMTGNVIPSPVAGFGFVYAISGFRGAALKAIKYAGAKGDVTDSDKVAWSYDKDTPYVPSPLLYEDTLYFLDNNRALVTCLNARTGEPYYSKQRLEGMEGVYASPIGAAGRVYIAGRDGKVLVLERGPEFKVLATNSLDDGFDASPAAVEGELYLRGHKFLYCLAKN